MRNYKNEFNYYLLTLSLVCIFFSLIAIFNPPTNSFFKDRISVTINKFAYNANQAVLSAILIPIQDNKNKTLQIETLQKHIDELMIDNNELKKLELLNNYYRMQIDNFEEYLNFKDTVLLDNVITARVFTQFHSNINQYVSLDVGSNVGVSNNKLVIYIDGVIGYTNNIHEKTSEVALITSKDFRISGRTRKSQLNVIVQGNNNSFLSIKAYKEFYEFIDGEAVYTSGLENQYPAGLLLGYVVKSNNQYTMIPAKNINNLQNFVFVLQ